MFFSASRPSGGAQLLNIRLHGCTRTNHTARLFVTLAKRKIRTFEVAAVAGLRQFQGSRAAWASRVSEGQIRHTGIQTFLKGISNTELPLSVFQIFLRGAAPKDTG